MFVMSARPADELMVVCHGPTEAGVSQARNARRMIAIGNQPRRQIRAGEGKEERIQVGALLITRDTEAVLKEPGHGIHAAIVRKTKTGAAVGVQQVHSSLVEQVPQLLRLERQFKQNVPVR